MTLEYLEIMEDVKKTQEMAEQTSATPSTARLNLYMLCLTSPTMNLSLFSGSSPDIAFSTIS